MDWVGTGKKLVEADFTRAAEILGCLPATVHGLMEVEASGSGFDSKHRPKILFEPHIFWKELGPGEKRDRAAAQGLAYSTWGAKPYPSSSDGQYARLDAAILIDEEAALRSASWGLGQIMGFWRDDLKYNTAREFVEDVKAGEDRQMNQFIGVIEKMGLKQAMKDRDAVKIAKTYNGPAYAKNQYDTKIAAAWNKWDKKLAGQPKDPVGGPKHEEKTVTLEDWKELQGVLNRLGLATPPLVVDGDPGAKTLAAAKGLVPLIEVAQKE